MDTRKTMIVALARKLLIALWHFVTTGETLEGVVLRPGLTGTAYHSALFGARAGFSADCRIDDPRWREAVSRTWHRCRPREWARRPELAADAHDCIMVRIQTDLPNTSLRREDAAQWQAPLGSSADRHRQTPELCKRPLSQFIIPPRAQASRRCETQATLGGKPPSCASVSVP
jgi:hypothetical protein